MFLDVDIIIVPLMAQILVINTVALAKSRARGSLMELHINLHLNSAFYKYSYNDSSALIVAPITVLSTPRDHCDSRTYSRMLRT